jgi:hypothetical protein
MCYNRVRKRGVDMATLNGWKLGKIIEFEGREGEGWQAIVSKDGDPLGLYSWDADGAYEGRWEGNWSDLKSIKGYGTGYDDFFEDLRTLTEKEKVFKKAVKKGFVGIVVTEDSEGGTCIFRLVHDRNQEEVTAELIRHLGDCKVTYYRSLDDFKVTAHRATVTRDKPSMRMYPFD